jgi:hypothetical protein
MLCCSAEQHKKLIPFIPSFDINIMLVAEMTYHGLRNSDDDDNNNNNNNNNLIHY